MSETCVELKNLSKRFFILQSQTTTLRLLKAFFTGRTLKKDLWALKDVSFKIKKGEKVALIGKNGSGKTTLLRVISGIYSQTSGYVRVTEKPLVLFKLGIGFNGEISTIDNIYLFGAIHGMGRVFLKERIDEILEMAEISHLRYTYLKDLSFGQRQRLALSIFFQVEADFSIFDESLGSIDQSFAQKCDEYFSRFFLSPKTFIIASHDLPFLRRYCRRALWFNEGGLYKDGDAQEIIAEYERS